MLHQPMRYVLLLLSFCMATMVHAQVSLDSPLRFTGQEIDAGIDGIAPPSEPSSVITAGFAASGAQHWATASIVGDTIILNVAVPPDDYQNGMLLRFMLSANRIARTFVRVVPLVAVPILRSDGLDPVLGDLQTDALHEIIYTNGRFTLLCAKTAECPPNSILVNENFCIQTSRRSQINFHDAISYCADRGGRLCSWDEFYAACTMVGDQLQNLHSEWEWLNDMSDHTHSADQVGRNSCTSQRGATPIYQGYARCCFSIR